MLFGLCLHLQDGTPPEEISEQLQYLGTRDALAPVAYSLPSLPRPLPRHTLKLHSPPRASNKLVQTIRHAAAKAVEQLGLSGQVGLVRVSGWLRLDPGWVERYKKDDMHLTKLADDDPSKNRGFSKDWDWRL